MRSPVTKRHLRIAWDSTTKKSKHHVHTLTILFVAWAFLMGFLFNLEYRATTTYIHDAPARVLISNKASLDEVSANFLDPPAAVGTLDQATQQLNAAGGFTCAMWSNGVSGVGWIVLRCTK